MKNSLRSSDDWKPLHSIIVGNLRDDKKPWQYEKISSLQSCLQKQPSLVILQVVQFQQLQFLLKNISDFGRMRVTRNGETVLVKRQFGSTNVTFKL